MYKSGNPFKRPCPLVALSSNRNELQILLDKYTEHGSLNVAKAKVSGRKGKPNAAEALAHRKLLKGIEDERLLAEKIGQLLPAVEKEQAVSHFQ